MPIFNRSCCCLSLRTGTVIIGALSHLFYVALGVVLPRVLTTLINKGKGIMGAVDAIGSEAGVAVGVLDEFAPIWKTFEGVRTGMVVICCFCVTAASVLILSAFTRWKWFLLPHLVMQPVFLVVLLYQMYSVMQLMGKVVKYFKIDIGPYLDIILIVVAVLLGLIQMYGELMVLSYFFQIRSSGANSGEYQQ